MLELPRARITGIGSYLPEKVLTNHDLEKLVDTSDEWIVSRTGMKERRVASDHVSSSDMALHAGLKAIEDAKEDPSEIDLIIVSTATPDYLMPATAAIVQAKLGASRAACFDMQAACTGYLYGLSTAKAYVESKMYRKVLLIAVDKMSAFLDYEDRNTCVLFGDGATACFVKGTGTGFTINSITLGADGALHELIMIPAGGSRLPASSETLAKKKHYFQMEGKDVFKQAIRKMALAAKQSIELAGLKEDEISWFIPHQANVRIIEALAKNLKVPLTKFGNTIHKYGNTSGSSVGITLDEVREKHPMKEGDHVLITAFGSGLTWGASVLTWKEESL